MVGVSPLWAAQHDVCLLAPPAAPVAPPVFHPAPPAAPPELSPAPRSSSTPATSPVTTSTTSGMASASQVILKKRGLEDFLDKALRQRESHDGKRSTGFMGCRHTMLD